MKVPQFLAKQLSHPSGFVGKYIMGGLLNKKNIFQNESVFNQLNLRSGDRVLEIGFGGADLLGKIIEQTVDGLAAGVDISDEMVKNACEKFRVQIESGRIEIKKGDVELLPYPASFFNKVCSVNTIYFWPDLPRCFLEINRVLRPGGLLILCYASEEYILKAHLNEKGFLHYSNKELEKELIANGFQRVSIQPGSDKRGEHFVLTAERKAEI